MDSAGGVFWISVSSLVISFIVALAVVYREFIHDWIFRPKLDITFSLNAPHSRVTLLEGGKKGFWPRLLVKNNGKRVALRCEGILDEVRMLDGTIDTRYDPLVLRWATAPIAKGLLPLDIAQKRQVFLNIFTTIEGEENAPFATYVDAVGVPLYLEPRQCWFRIVIYGDNFTPVSKGYAIQWDGKEFEEVNVCEMDEPPKSIKEWPWPVQS